MKSFKNLRQGLNEARDIGSEETPPAMLVLRRRGVRLFPDGQRVALFTNDRYKLMFTVPYGSSYLNVRPGSPLVATQMEAFTNVMPGVGPALVNAVRAKIRSKYGLDKEEPKKVKKNVRRNTRRNRQP